MAKFLISFTILALLFPYMLIGTINDLYYNNTYLQFFIVLFASFKLAYLSSFKYQNIIQITFWIYIYIFLGIVSLLQLLTNTFPWKGEYSSDIISSSQLIIIVGLFSYELGIMINQKIKFSKNKHKILKGIQLSNKNYIILTFIFILIAFLALQNLGGFDTLISARNDKYTIIKEILPQTILSILDGLVKTVPVTILLMSILMYQFSIFNSKKFFIYLIFLLLVVLFLNNPISTPRYQVGTLILSILFILFWGKMKAYFTRSHLSSVGYAYEKYNYQRISKPNRVPNSYMHSHARSMGRKKINKRYINMLNALYYHNGISVPLSFEIIEKYEYSDIESKEVKRKAIKNRVKFKYILMDTWFGAKENFEFITKHKKEFISAIKSNRLIALSLEDKKQGRFISVNTLELSEKQSIRGYLKEYDKEILLVRRIFKNKDGSIGILHLVSSDMTLNGDSLSTIYEKRWKVEEFFKSLKYNVDFALSLTKKVRTQSNHIFLSILAFFKLECLKIKHNINHFSLRAKLLIRANQVAFQELQAFKGA